MEEEAAQVAAPAEAGDEPAGPDGPGGATATAAPPGSETGGARRPSGRTRQRRQREAEEQDTPMYRLKVEGAHALGLWEKVQAVGWGGLSAAESGRVGGYITRILRAQRQEAPQDSAPPAGGG